MTATLPTTAPAAPTDRRLLLAGAVGAPLWGVVALTQAALRSDFDFSTQPLSLLSTGTLGWVQIVNLVVGGVLTVLGGIGLRRTAPEDPWLGRLTVGYGLGFVGAGFLVMDPVGSTGLSRHALGHMLTGTLAFAALAAACLVLAVRFRREGRSRSAVVSVVAAASVVAGNAWAMAGGALGSMTLGFGVLAAMVWLAVVIGRSAR